MIDEPILQRRGPFQTQIANDRLDRLERVEDVHFPSTHLATQSTKAVESLLAKRLSENEPDEEFRERLNLDFTDADVYEEKEV